MTIGKRRHLYACRRFHFVGANTTFQRRVVRAALHSIDEVFRHLEHGDPPHRKEPSSVKKMLKGDAVWSLHERLFGWEFDTEAMALNLPPHQLDRLCEVLS
jgi:hypothetical protein